MRQGRMGSGARPLLVAAALPFLLPSTVVLADYTAHCKKGVCADGEMGDWSTRFGTRFIGGPFGNEEGVIVSGKGIIDYGYIGERYEGEIAANEANGKGVKRLASLKTGSGNTAGEGGTYAGEMSKGDMEGYGVLTNADGTTYRGQFHHDTVEGLAVRESASGAIYEGELVEGLAQGWGVAYDAAGEITYAGKWTQNQPTKASLFSVSKVSLSLNMGKQGAALKEADAEEAKLYAVKARGAAATADEARIDAMVAAEEARELRAKIDADHASGARKRCGHGEVHLGPVCCPAPPSNATFTFKPETAKTEADCRWTCDEGLARRGDRKRRGAQCCPAKPTQSEWTDSSGVGCAFTCAPGYTKRPLDLSGRQGSRTCCPDLPPAHAVWAGPVGCDFTSTCPADLVVTEDGHCCSPAPERAVHSADCSWRCEDYHVQRGDKCCKHKATHSQWVAPDECAYKCDTGYHHNNVTGRCCAAELPLDGRWTNGSGGCTYECLPPTIRRKESCCPVKPAHSHWKRDSNGVVDDCTYICSKGYTKTAAGNCVTADEFFGKGGDSGGLDDPKTGGKGLGIGEGRPDVLSDPLFGALIPDILLPSDGDGEYGNDPGADLMAELMAELGIKMDEHNTEAERVQVEVARARETASKLSAQASVKSADDAAVGGDGDGEVEAHEVKNLTSSRNVLVREANARVREVDETIEAVAKDAEVLLESVSQVGHRLYDHDGDGDVERHEEGDLDADGVVSPAEAKLFLELKAKLAEAEAQLMRERRARKTVESEIAAVRADIASHHGTNQESWSKYRAERSMSVNHELVEVQNSKTGKWMAIDGAVLDTGNAVMTTITPTWRRQLGLSLSGETTKVQGVTDKLEEWPLTEPIMVRIKGEVMTLPSVAVGGTTPILCGEPDLIRPLLKRGYIFSSDEL